MIFLWEQSSETSEAEARREIQMPEIHENIQKINIKTRKKLCNKYQSSLLKEKIKIKKTAFEQISQIYRCQTS